MLYPYHSAEVILPAKRANGTSDPLRCPKTILCHLVLLCTNRLSDRLEITAPIQNSDLDREYLGTMYLVQNTSCRGRVVDAWLPCAVPGHRGWEFLMEPCVLAPLPLAASGLASPFRSFSMQPAAGAGTYRYSGRGIGYRNTVTDVTRCRLRPSFHFHSSQRCLSAKVVSKQRTSCLPSS